MTDEKETFEAWIEDCKKKIRDLQAVDLAQSGSFNAILSKYLTPFHYFKMDRDTTTRPAGPSPFGSERTDAGTAQQRGGSATANSESSSLPKCERCKKEFTPRVKGAKLCLDCWKKERRR